MGIPDFGLARKSLIKTLGVGNVIDAMFDEFYQAAERGYVEVGFITITRVKIRIRFGRFHEGGFLVIV